MKTDLTQTIKNIEGGVAEQKYKEMETNAKGKKVEVLKLQPVTLGKVIRSVVLSTPEQPNSPTIEEHELRYSIYEKVENLKEADLTEEEIYFIKGLIAKNYIVFFAAQLNRLFK